MTYLNRHRLDSNHKAIVGVLEAHGLTVLSLSKVGGGVPDLLVANHRGGWLVEVKTKTGKLEDSQTKFAQRWPWKIHVIRSEEEAIQFARDVAA